jgi:hypothetical protein
MISPGFIEISGAYGMITGISRGVEVSEEAARQRIVEMPADIPVWRPGKAGSGCGAHRLPIIGPRALYFTNPMESPK